MFTSARISHSEVMIVNRSYRTFHRTRESIGGRGGEKSIAPCRGRSACGFSSTLSRYRSAVKWWAPILVSGGRHRREPVRPRKIRWQCPPSDIGWSVIGREIVLEWSGAHWTRAAVRKCRILSCSPSPSILSRPLMMKCFFFISGYNKREGN